MLQARHYLAVSVRGELGQARSYSAGHCHAHNSMCAVMTASTPTSSTEGERGQGYGRGACVRVCCGPNAGMSLIYYHLRGWWCSGSVMWCCCCRSAAGSNRLRCASLFWNSCRLKEVAARGGGPLRLRGTWHGLGRYSLVPCTTGCLARPGAMPGQYGCTVWQNS